ncbi:phosphonate ABC transporter ATP-binding protein [Granulicatella sp. zg-ZJ]|uniref:phosphonate ABC transporter ATP-binding protein n=1 Tax=Granulicatella sp. zg-ZJ TaxID=2678504 RepID=UPI0013D61452|nr:phosphonate ABC transporter ATP-binding protein [Granulicatella sp. zg-ZJ]MBS4750103.1 phosphonate ABC transporter ATP-binding protein [Carnobacteriaceae bacterium zg-ZUI78]NEW62144.1 phosphonate ABC transporter ATP-binding protein [Granulicatella sp. zg-ZJ]
MIEFKKVSKTYPNGTKGLIDVDVTIEQGEFIAIIGLSGSGKSTFIRCVNKMHDITSGELFVNGQNVQKITGRDVRKFRRNIGMVFQSFNLVTRTTVIKNVLTAFVPELSGFRKFFGIFPRECKIKSLEALDKVDMFEKAYVRVDQLSGGQQQRVALARALAQNPEIILADEPVAALDPVTSNQVMDDFRRINKENNITILLNIHDVDLALKYCDRVIGINKGHIVYDGSAKDVTKDILEKIYQKDLFSNGE